jgi:hypothetical protein
VVAKGVRRRMHLIELLITVGAAAAVGLVASAVATWLVERIRRSSSGAVGEKAEQRINRLSQSLS